MRRQKLKGGLRKDDGKERFGGGGEGGKEKEGKVSKTDARPKHACHVKRKGEGI